jgi:transcriptional regulator
MTDDHEPNAELLPGTLEMIILQTLSMGPMHGYAIGQHIERLSENVFRVERGTLYPALERLLHKGWVTAKWGESPTKRRARYYTITPSGRKRLGAEVTSFERVMQAMNRLMHRA